MKASQFGFFKPLSPYSLLTPVVRWFGRCPRIHAIWPSCCRPQIQHLLIQLTPIRRICKQCSTTMQIEDQERTSTAAFARTETQSIVPHLPRQKCTKVHSKERRTIETLQPIYPVTQPEQQMQRNRTHLTKTQMIHYTKLIWMSYCENGQNVLLLLLEGKR